MVIAVIAVITMHAVITVIKPWTSPNTTACPVSDSPHIMLFILKQVLPHAWARKREIEKREHL
jgi:hypothetical protein